MRERKMNSDGDHERWVTFGVIAFVLALYISYPFW